MLTELPSLIKLHELNPNFSVIPTLFSVKTVLQFFFGWALGGT